MWTLIKLQLVCLLFSSGGEEVNKEVVQASYYADKFQGRQTASSDIYTHDKLTGASNVYDLGDSVEVCNTDNGKCVIIEINDRIHPRFRHRVDLTPRAFKAIGELDKGILNVETRKINNNEGQF